MNTAEIIAALPVEDIADCLLSTDEAAAELGVSKRRVLALINAENPERKLRAAKVGREFVIKKSDLEAVRGRKGGRPAHDEPNAAALAKRQSRERKG